MEPMGWTSWEQWQEWLQEDEGYNTLPLLVKFMLPESETLPASWESVWEQSGPHSIVLESGKGGRYTYLGKQPTEVMRGKGSSRRAAGACSGWPACRSAPDHRRFTA